MIHLIAVPRPAKLTDELVIKLTKRYKQTGKSVWIQRFIKEALLNMSHGKCSFCECNIVEESKYLEVEHFFTKSIYETKVVDWDNLLPACKRCNGCKSDHDTVLEPIVHPVNDKPNEHLKFNLYFFKSKTSLGKMTIEVLQLNDIRIRHPRQKIGSKTREQLDNLEDWVEQYEQTPTIRLRNKIHAFLHAILIEAQPNSEYSATVATVIWHDDSYHFVKNFFQKQGWWHDEFQELERAIQSNAFETA